MSGMEDANSIPYTFDTALFSQEERFDRWKDWLSPVVTVDPGSKNLEKYQAKHESWVLDNFIFTREETTGGICSRSESQRKHSMDYWYLYYLKDGSHSTDAGNGSGAPAAMAQAGDLGFYSFAQVSRAEVNEVAALGLFIPRSVFPRHTDKLDRLSNSILATPRGRILGDYMLSLEREVATLSRADLAAMAQATHAMVEACLLSAADTQGAEISFAETMRTKVVRYIEHHLFEPSLTPERICREVGVSRSVLYRTFEPMGGVMYNIRQARLRAAYNLLAGQHGTRQVSKIARAVGFVDASDFSRSFNRTFGCSPSAVRARLSPDLLGAKSWTPT